jgi:hypothetical protein
MKRIPVPPEEDLRRMYIDQKMSQEDIGPIYGASQTLVGQWLMKYQIPRRRGGNVKQINVATEDMKRMYVDEKKTMGEIAQILGRGESGVRNSIIRLGLAVDPAENRDRRMERNKKSCSYRFKQGGYVVVKGGDSPNIDANGYIPEHRLMAENAIGRPILPVEKVHHINAQKLDNRIENLAVLPSVAVHLKLHRYMEHVACFACGLTEERPKPFVFSREVFWGGSYITQIDLIADAEASGRLRVPVISAPRIEPKEYVI